MKRQHFMQILNISSRPEGPGTSTLTCPAHGDIPRRVWIQPCCDSSCPAGRGFLREKRSPGQSGPLWTCSRHTRVASKPGNTQIARLATPASGVPATKAKTDGQRRKGAKSDEEHAEKHLRNNIVSRSQEERKY